MDLDMRSALVTGSTSEISLAIATFLARRGARVAMNGLAPPGDGEAVAARLAEETGSQVCFADVDGADPEAIEFDRVEEFGAVDVLVNNAGVQYVAPVEYFARDQRQGVTIRISHRRSAPCRTRFCDEGAALGPNHKRSLAHGLGASSYKSAYVASKHGVLGLTMAVALGAAATDVTCNAVDPGWVRTPMAQVRLETRVIEAGVDLGDAERRLIEPRQPSSWFIPTDDLASLVLYPMSRSASRITDAAMQIDGGRTAQ